MSSPTYAIESKLYTHWIHCNICYKQYIKKEQLFYLLACHHVICNLCLTEVSQTINGPRAYRCGMCQKITRACVINNTMPKHLKDFFHPQPYLDGLDTVQITKFQIKHRQRFLEYMERQENYQTRAKGEIKKSIETARQLYQEYEHLKAERRHLENIYGHMRRQGAGDNRSLSSSSGYSSTGYY